MAFLLANYAKLLDVTENASLGYSVPICPQPALETSAKILTPSLYKLKWWKENVDRPVVRHVKSERDFWTFSSRENTEFNFRVPYSQRYLVLRLDW